MKTNFLKPMLLSALVITALQFPSCKGKSTESTTSTDTVLTDTVSQTAPVLVAGDEELTINTKDAIKDFPEVTAIVKDGEINLTGNITRDKLQQLMKNLSALNAKKINNNLTITK